MGNLYWRSDAQMERVRPFLPKSHGRHRVDDRRVPSGMIFINRNELRWRDAPKEYGPAKTVVSGGWAACRRRGGCWPTEAMTPIGSDIP